MKILCVTSVKNEGPFLLEWLAHMMGAGVDEFLIYSNDCEDGTDDMLARLHDAGVVTHVPQVLAEGESPQWSALRAAWKHPLRKDCDWAIVCDVDEFVNIHVGDHSLRALIDAVPSHADGILLPWRLFGNNGVAFAVDAPVTETFTAAMPADCTYPVAATFFKSLVKTGTRFNQFGVHRPKQKAPEKAGQVVWADGSGAIMPEQFAANPQRLSLYGYPSARKLVELNHYSLRSAESFLVKRARGLPNRSEKQIDLAYWVDRNFNTERDTSIAQMRPATVEKMRVLNQLEGVGDLHAQAVSWHGAKFREMIQEEAHHRLFSQILVAGSSAPVAPQIAHRLVSWYQTVHHKKQNGGAAR